MNGENVWHDWMVYLYRCAVSGDVYRPHLRLSNSSIDQPTTTRHFRFSVSESLLDCHAWEVTWTRLCKSNCLDLSGSLTILVFSNLKLEVGLTTKATALRIASPSRFSVHEARKT